MFKLYQPHYTKTLDEYKNLEQTLIDEKEKQISIISQVQGRWKGQAAETYTALYQEFLTKGEYFRAQFINSREIEIMDGELGNINRLMARCEQLGRQLQQDEYVAPVLPADGDGTIYNDGYLTMDYDYIPYVNAAIDNALQSADEGRDILLEAAEICSEVMDMSEYTSMIHKADRKIHRLENYRRAFNEYADGVQELENRMSSRFRALKNEYEEMKDGKWEQIADMLCSETGGTTKPQISQKPDTKISDVSDDGTEETDSAEEKIDRFMDTPVGGVMSIATAAANPLFIPFVEYKTMYDVFIKGAEPGESLNDTLEGVRGYAGSVPKVAEETVSGIIGLPGAAMEIKKQIDENGFRNTMENMKTGIIENAKDTIVNDIILGDSRSRGEVFGRGALAVGEIVFGSKGIAQGIKGTGAAKKAVSAVDMMGDAADAVGDTAKGVKILGKIEDAEDIADTAGDVAESARKAEKVIDGIESGRNTVNTLTDAQKSRLNSLENTINDHLTEGDFSGTLRDLQGDPVPNGKGGYFDHLGEMKDSYSSLKKIKKGLEGSLKNPNLSDVDRALLQEGLDKANLYIKRIQEMFKPYGGIE